MFVSYGFVPSFVLSSCLSFPFFLHTLSIFIRSEAMPQKRQSHWWSSCSGPWTGSSLPGWIWVWTQYLPPAKVFRVGLKGLWEALPKSSTSLLRLHCSHPARQAWVGWHLLPKKQGERVGEFATRHGGSGRMIAHASSRKRSH